MYQMIFNFNLNHLNNLVSINDYKELISYDPNGNILTYLRNGTSATNLLMDNMTYHYNTGNNQLNHVTDLVASGNYSVDIDNQSSNNYQYDAIGNLIKDNAEGISPITWNVYGKISSITKSSGTITYTYDATGNRISKTVGGVTTLYVRDASGNVMTVYEIPSMNTIVQKELHIYGSSRLGMITGELEIEAVSLPSEFGEGRIVSYTRGKKYFELSNHLGNVQAIVSDKRISVTGGVYEADIVSATDYAPFGMGLVGRSYSSGEYRYGFQSQEKDNEIKGLGNSVNYKYRMHDSRTGRFFAVDPLFKQYPWNSSYSFSENKVIHAIELEGLEAHVLTQNFNSNGDFQSSNFTWDETAAPVKDGQIHYYKNIGNNSTHTIINADANSIGYRGPTLNPTKAPSSIFGTQEYYKWRENDFNVRHGLMDKWYTIQPNAPDYYMEYGNKYIQRFSVELYPRLSPSGQGWLDRALVNLQSAIETELQINSQVELNNRSFRKFAFNSHVRAYEDAGLFDLPITDLLKIGMTPNISDLFSRNGMKQIMEISNDYIRHSKENPLKTTFRVAELGIRIFQYFNKEKSDD